MAPSLRTRLADGIYTVGFMAATTLVSISVVAAVHLAGADAVARNARLYLQRGIMEAAGLAVPADPAALRAWYDGAVEAVPSAEPQPTFYIVRDREGGPVRAYVFPRVGAGLWGAIHAVIGMTPDATRFTGVAFTEQNETPGLGARIAEPWYREHIRGRTGGLRLVDEGTRATDPTALDAITGATVTSTAVRDMLNRLADEAPDLVKGHGAP